MTNTSAITTATPSHLSTSGTSATNPSTNMGQNQFLMLMMDQLKAQDPLSPSDPTQYLSELASFSSLQEQTTIATSTQNAATQQSSTAALGLLGRNVAYTDSAGATQTGTVTKVDFTSKGPMLTVGSTGGIPLSSITEAS